MGQYIPPRISRNFFGTRKSELLHSLRRTVSQVGPYHVSFTVQADKGDEFTNWSAIIYSIIYVGSSGSFRDNALSFTLMQRQEKNYPEMPTLPRQYIYTQYEKWLKLHLARRANPR